MKYFRELSVAVVLFGLLGVLAVVAPAFFDARPLRSLAAREAPTLVVAAGMALVILCRQIDISVGSQFAWCGVVAGLLAAQHWPLAVAAVVAIAAGAMLGAINGALVAGLRLPSIVVTLATMVAWREGLRWWRQGQFVDLPENIQWMGFSQRAGQGMLITVGVAVLVLLAAGLRKLAAGRWIYAVGSDEEAARLAGIRPRAVTFWVFVAMGALSGLAAMMNVLQSPQVDPKAGTGLELRVIAAVVVGGVAITGGRGNLWGVLAGALLLACVSPALTYLHVEAYWSRAIEGAIILLAVIADGVRSGKERR
ncbi:MAG TPA: ABC transporter permease [Opitutus sp.]|nr:ABC transporter permease [Opitutus sp.]